MKIVTIVGARPQFIKAATVSRAIKHYNEQINPARSKITEIIVHTGQHYDHNMSKIFFEELEIPRPLYNLGVGSDTHGRQTGKMFSAIEEVLEKEKPDWVLVYGDTNSTLAGALAASKLHVSIAHVEAGLRSFNRGMPEEINRIVADHISTILFCPTQTAVSNLKKEGFNNIPDSIDPRNFIPAGLNNPIVLNVGDVMYDSALFYAKKTAHRTDILHNLKITPKEYCLATIHRAENTEDVTKLSNILRGLDAVSREIPIIWPVHPRSKRLIDRVKGNISLDRLRVIGPIGYLDFIILEKQAKMIFTDSGGVQKEAYFFNVPCVTLRDETEWVETSESGMNVLSGTDTAKIYEAFKQFAMKPCAVVPGLFGDGFASKKIVDTLSILGALIIKDPTYEQQG